MCTYKLDEGGFERVGKVNDKAILVSADVEDGSVVSDKVHVISKRSLQVRGFTPVTLGNDLIPSTEGYRGLRVSQPKGLECLPRYYIHSLSMFPTWDQSIIPKVGTFNLEHSSTLARVKSTFSTLDSNIG